ncbi:hypothetical protein PsorP6_006836 [Peronosclerospora sorghi]|uniref:Uncharacterized protein n=1 Tax=Peronosclerospora sorghi TaxID=230839 RepID=A0ACC0W9P2_9STRA|nr:hypothetical protein PsorP6_006836 [Peronosclerospora sorghi]
MLGVERNIEVRQSLMLSISLVFDPKEDSGHINLAVSALWRVGAQPFMRSVERDPYAPIPINLGGNAGASQGFANEMLSLEDSVSQDPRVAFSYLRYLWAENREDSNTEIRRTKICADYVYKHTFNLVNGKYRWLSLTKNLMEPLTTCSNVWKPHKAGPDKPSRMARMGSNELSSTGNKISVKESSLGDTKQYAARAIQGFFRSISFGHTSYDVTKDVIRLLTLWFAQGNRSDVHMDMVEGFHEVSIDTWFNVIYQLIARIDTPNQKTSDLLHDLLTRIGQAHPHALIYPITMASKALNPTRKLAAERILAAVRRHSSQLVYETYMVSQELIRVAILWNELWHGALEEVSKHFFNNRDVAAMIAELATLHEQMDQIGTEETPSLREATFYQAFARDLKYAKEWTNVYELTKSLDDLNPSWDIYYGLANLSTLELVNVHQEIGTVHDVQSSVLWRKEAVGRNLLRLDDRPRSIETGAISVLVSVYCRLRGHGRAGSLCACATRERCMQPARGIEQVLYALTTLLEHKPHGEQDLDVLALASTRVASRDRVSSHRFFSTGLYLTSREEQTKQELRMQHFETPPFASDYSGESVRALECWTQTEWMEKQMGAEKVRKPAARFEGGRIDWTP